jgi:hypothetical protein
VIFRDDATIALPTRSYGVNGDGTMPTADADRWAALLRDLAAVDPAIYARLGARRRPPRPLASGACP